MKPTTDEFISKLAKGTAPVQRLMPTKIRFFSWLMASIFSILVGVVLIGLRDNIMDSLSNPHFLIETFLTLAVALTSAFSAFILSVPGEEKTRFFRLAPIIAFTLWILFILFQIFHTHQDHYSLLQELRRGYYCAADIIALGVLPGILLFIFLKRAAPLRLGWSGAFAMLAVTALAALALQFTCASGSIWHLLLWHFFPVAVIAILGVYLGKLLLRW